MAQYDIKYDKGRGERTTTLYAETWFHAQEMAMRFIGVEKNQIVSIKKRTYAAN